MNSWRSFCSRKAKGIIGRIEHDNIRNPQIFFLKKKILFWGFQFYNVGLIYFVFSVGVNFCYCLNLLKEKVCVFFSSTLLSMRDSNH